MAVEDFTHILPLAEGVDRPFYLYEKDREEKCAFLTLNRPERRNAVTEHADAEMIAAIDDWENDDQVKCVVIQAKGKHFCGGHDLGTWGGGDVQRDVPRAERRHPNSYWLARGVPGWSGGALHRLFTSVKPTIAAVRGVAIQYGNHIHTYCDMTIASETALFGNLGETLGISGGTQNRHFISLIGYKRYREMVMTGKLISGKEAELWGLVNRAVPDDKLEEEVMNTVRRIALVPVDGLVFGKSFLVVTLTDLGIMNTTSSGFAWAMGANRIWHQPDEFHFFKVARERGISAAIHERNARYQNAPVSRGLIVGEPPASGVM